MKGTLYTPDEWKDVGDYLADHFQTDQPTRDALSKWQLEEMRMFLRSPMFAMRNYFITANKDADLVLMDPFIGQTILDLAIESQRRKGFAQRVVEIKPRQVGWTQWDLGRALWAAMHPNTRVLVLVDDEDVAQSLGVRLGTLINNLPVWMQPMRRINNLKSVVFDNPNAKLKRVDPGLNSSIQITVPSSMRGITPQFCVVSEFAFMEFGRATEVMEGLIAPMPLSVNSCVIIDTTPNGHDDLYEPMVLAAIERNPRWVKQWERKTIPTRQDVINGILGEPDRPRSGFVPAFCPWFWHEQYTTRDDNKMGEMPKMSALERQHVEATLGKVEDYGGEEELELAKRYGVTTARLFWRRCKIDSYEQATKRLRLLSFRQEYASSWESCFVSYGSAPFDVEGLDAVMRQGREPAARGILRQEGKAIVLDQTFHSDWEEVRVYAPPEDGVAYTMGVDTGIAYESSDSDASVAQIVRCRDDKLVCTYTSRVPPHILRRQLMLLYRWYNNCKTGIELKGIGYDLVRQCLDAGMTNQYYWKRIDKAQPEPSAYPGWDTSEKTRPRMESILSELIGFRDPATGQPSPRITIPDIETLRELSSVERTPTGSIKSKNGHDDHVDALMIALAVARDPYDGYREPKPREVIKEINALIRSFGFGRAHNRNHPDLANL